MKVVYKRIANLHTLKTPFFHPIKIWIVQPQGNSKDYIRWLRCILLVGSAGCSCRHGFIGDGITCRGNLIQVTLMAVYMIHLIYGVIFNTFSLITTWNYADYLFFVHNSPVKTILKCFLIDWKYLKPNVFNLKVIFRVCETTKIERAVLV